ncbi:uncharacterized protein BcabD6B2_06580 [Babesia caballi]|uniref:Trafficking protein particle complex subunit 11 domain-containing protein n=1 Tax=Babesia caballi TaxID=5871 RepID=A0AAV4LN01_BABCB|nr:hypothetical protein, conserved [Babesia caballi]
MDTLPPHLVSVPLPCAALAYYNDSQLVLRDFLLAAGRANTTNNQDRLNLVVSEGCRVTDAELASSQQWEQDATVEADWVLLQRNLPPCLICVRDWQNYVVDESWSGGNPEAAADSTPNEGALSDDNAPSDEDNTPQSPPQPNPDLHGGSPEMRGDMKRLNGLIKADVEQCMMAYRRNFLDKRPVAGRIMFLILLREGTKNPQKAVSSLKYMNSNEVAAVCVTCGEVEISTKVSKLEQLAFDICVAYYERRIYLLTKTLSKVKPTAGPSVDETSEINAAMASFKLAYFHQFLGNFKESAQVLVQAWSHVIPAAVHHPCEAYASVALYIALQVVSVRFALGSNLEALAFAFEAAAFFKRLLRTEALLPMYYNACYLLYHSVALHLDKAVEYKELKANSHLRHHAVNFHKWSIHHLMNLRLILMRGAYDDDPPRKFASLLLRDDDDFGHLYSSASIECHGMSAEQRVRYLESVTENLLVQLMDALTACSWYQTLLQAAETLGDSLFSSFKLRDAFFVYANLGECLVNSIPLDADYLFRGCSSSVITEALKRSTTSRSAPSADSGDLEKASRLQPNFSKTSRTLLLAELSHSKLWWAFYRRVLAKMMVTLNLLLSQPIEMPVAVKSAASLPLMIYEDPIVTRFRGHSGTDSGQPPAAPVAREYTLILLKALLTMHSLTDTDLDVDAYASKLVARLSPRQDAVSSVLLSKRHKVQYMLGRAALDENVINTRLQVLVNFHVDLPFGIEVRSVVLCTSIGTFVFDIMEVASGEGHVEIYTSSCTGTQEEVHGDAINGRGSHTPADSSDDDSASDHRSDPDTLRPAAPIDHGAPRGKVAPLSGNSQVILAITCPAINNKFMMDSFSLLGVKLLWEKELTNGSTVSISCVMPSLVRCQPRGPTDSGESLFTADPTSGTFRLLDPVGSVGSSSALLQGEDIMDMTLINPKGADLRIALVDTIAELTAPGEPGADIGGLAAHGSLSVPSAHGVYRTFVNRIYFKVFLGSLVEGHVAPATCVLLYNKQILGADSLPHIRFSVEVTSSASSYLFYALCRDSPADSGSMRLCVNNKFAFNLTEFADVTTFDFDAQLDSRSGSEVDTMVPTLFADDPGFSCSISEDMDAFLELARRDANTGIVYIYGLLKVLSHGLTSVQFNLQMQPMLGNTLKAVESKFLVVTDITEALVHPPVSLELAREQVYDNTSGGFVKFLNIHLLNRSPVQYAIDTMDVVYDGTISAGKSYLSPLRDCASVPDQLYGFCNHLRENQGLRFMHLCPSTKRREGTVEVKCVHSVVHPRAFPFDHLRPCFQNVVTKGLSPLNEEDSAEIVISVSHKSTVNLGHPFELVAEIRNLTPHTLDCYVTLEGTSAGRVPFMVSGPRALELTSLPKAVNTLKWTLMANRCGHHTLPSVKLTQRRKLSLSADDFASVPSLVYVAPRSLEQA